TQLHIRAKRCICISISCGCYQQPSSSIYRQPSSFTGSIYRQPSSSSGLIYRQPLPSSGSINSQSLPSSGLINPQPLPSSYRQPIYRQQPDRASCITDCIQRCMQNQQNTCQQTCQNLCGTQTTYEQQKGNVPISYPYEPMTHEIATGQQSASGTCIHVCMPSCESQCIQRSTPVPTLPHHNGPIPVVQSQTPSYYPSQQYEPGVQQYSDNDNTICINLCMPSCESQCIERTTPADYFKSTSYSPDIDYPKPTSYSPGIDYPKSTPYIPGIDHPRPTPYLPVIDYPKSFPYSPSSSSSYQNYFPQANQTSIVIRPYQKSGTTTICLPICMPLCQTQCTENQKQNGGIDGKYGGIIEEQTIPNQTNLPPHEISINLPQSIQQSSDCMNLCHETCMEQCVEQSQPADQCQPSCLYTCQGSCPQSPVNTGTTNSIQQLQTESEIYETFTQPSENFINPSLSKTFLLRSPPYYSQNSFHESPIRESSLINCQSDHATTGQCNCPAGYATCLSAKSRIIQRKCCRKR
uniref:Keratinocyte proline-rich protein n=1 Tax=Loa loa TaxID=7209 RepID=A0A1I7W3E6_LOALO